VYDALNRQTVTVDALGNRTTTMLDAVGNVTEVLDASNNATIYAYNADYQLVSETNPMGHTGTFAYDADGDLASTTDYDGRVVTYAYDALDRMTGQTWHSGNASSSVTNRATYTYDADGDLLTAANVNGAYTMTYDALDRVTVVQELGWATLTFTYDADGNRTMVQDSFGGVQTSTYNAINELITQQITGPDSTQLQVDLSYTADGLISTESRDDTLGPGTPVGTSYYLYDAADRLTSITAIGTGSAVLETYTYDYDAASNLTQEVDNGTLVTYAYNADNEVTGYGAATLGYDATGNRTNTGYSTGTGNELLASGVYTYAYDNAGNQIGKTDTATGEQWVYSYDNMDELVSVVDTSTGGTVTSTYEYDAFGNRIEQSVQTSSATTVTKYALDGWDPALKGSTGNSNWNVWADLTSSNTIQTRYLWGDQVNELFARIGSTGTAAFLLTDHLESIVGVTNASGTLEDVITYDAYGNFTESNSGVVGSYTYAGMEFDSTTQLYYSRARYYDATTGRWISQDPLGFDAGDSNLYRYVNNQPTRGTDPSGLDVYIVGGDLFGIQSTGNVTSGRHYTIMWYDPATGQYVLFSGGGPSGTGAGAGSSAGTGTVIVGTSFPGWANATASRFPESGGKMSVIPITINGKTFKTIEELKKDRGDRMIKITTKLDDCTEELKAIDTAFKKMQQIPFYEIFGGPNSNTYAKQLLVNSGFTVPESPPGGRGWSYVGNYGYGGLYYDSNGFPTTLGVVRDIGGKVMSVSMPGGLGWERLTSLLGW
jgi:RHS repeat-associated protein